MQDSAALGATSKPKNLPADSLSLHLKKPADSKVTFRRQALGDIGNKVGATKGLVLQDKNGEQEKKVLVV